MLVDALTRLSGTRSVSGSTVTETPQDLDAAAAATPLLSENYMDLADTYRSNFATGAYSDRSLFGVFTIKTESLTASSAVATCEFQLITMPRTVVTGQTFTAAATDIITCAGDFLPNGTLVTVSTSAADLPDGLNASTHYYVVRDSAIVSPLTTFKLATTPDGKDRAGASTIVNILDAGTGTHTITHVPHVLASSGAVPLARLRISDAPAVGAYSGGRVSDQIVVCTNPLPHSPQPPLHRYLFARYVVSHDLTAGMAFCDVGVGVPANRRVYHPSGFQIK